MRKKHLIILAIATLTLITSACQSKKSGCPGSFHHKAAKNVDLKDNV